MKYTCKQCGKEFELTESEINFYKSKKLALPKRCKQCRDENKMRRRNDQKEDTVIEYPKPQSSISEKQSSNHNPISKWIYSIIAIILCFFAGGFGLTQYIDTNKDTNVQSQLDEQYTVRNTELLEEHYQKHGIEMGFSSVEAYLAAANQVVNNSAVLSKKEEEDGDDVYYLEETNEFVVISTDGYIRTYFCPEDGIDYYNRQ